MFFVVCSVKQIYHRIWKDNACLFMSVLFFCINLVTMISVHIFMCIVQQDTFPSCVAEKVAFFNRLIFHCVPEGSKLSCHCCKEVCIE